MTNERQASPGCSTAPRPLGLRGRIPSPQSIVQNKANCPPPSFLYAAGGDLESNLKKRTQFRSGRNGTTTFSTSSYSSEWSLLAVRKQSQSKPLLLDSDPGAQHHGKERTHTHSPETRACKTPKVPIQLAPQGRGSQCHNGEQCTARRHRPYSHICDQDTPSPNGLAVTPESAMICL